MLMNLAEQCFNTCYGEAFQLRQDSAIVRRLSHSCATVFYSYGPEMIMFIFEVQQPYLIASSTRGNSQLCMQRDRLYH